MLSRAQEARIRALIWGSSPGTLLTYCLEHLANSAKIPASHMSDLAVFVRSLHERGDCQRRFGGFCEAGRHETRQTLVWAPRLGCGPREPDGLRPVSPRRPRDSASLAPC